MIKNFAPKRKLSYERQTEIRNMSEPPIDPVENEYWHYYRYMLFMLDHHSGNGVTWGIDRFYNMG